MNKTLFRSTIGVDNRRDSSSLVYDQETGVTQFESADNVLIDRSGKVASRKGHTLQQAGTFISSFPDEECFYVLEDRTTDSALLKAEPGIDGSLTMTGLRSPLTLGAKGSFCLMDEKIYYVNGSEYGVVESGASIDWPESIWPRSTTNQFETTPIGELVEIFASRFFMATGKEVIWTEVGRFGIYNANRNRRLFESEVTMIAAVAGGVYISDSKSVYFFAGLDPNKWVMDNKVLNYPACKYGRLAGLVDPSFYGLESSQPSVLFATKKGPVIGLPDGTCFNLIDKQYELNEDFTGIHDHDGVVTQAGVNGCVSVQSAIGGIGSKATSLSSESFDNVITCKGFTYGVNGTGIYLLNQSNSDNGSGFESSFTLATSDYGAKNNKRFRRIYVEIEVEEEIEFTVSVRPNKGDWITKTVTIPGPGLKTTSFTISKSNGLGNYHTVKFSSTGQFKINSIEGLLIVRPLGVRRS